MTSPSALRRLRAAACIVLAAGGAACASDGVSPEPRPAVCREPALAELSADVPALWTDAGDAPLTDGQAGFLAQVRAEPWAARVHLARLADGADALLRSAERVAMPVAAGKGFVAVPREVTVRGPADLSWWGNVEGVPGGTHLVLTGSGVGGSLQVMPVQGPSVTYVIQPLGGGLHAVTCVDASLVPED